MKRVSLLLLFLLCTQVTYAQKNFLNNDQTLLQYRVAGSAELKLSDPGTANGPDEYPEPSSVLYRSLMIPGWGQVTNRQIWKVPVIYGIFAGIGYYTYLLHDVYRDYRTAYYNAVRGEETDFKFGPTPDRLVGINQNQLRTQRNSLRNQRDFMFIVMGLAYALNAIDAYVFAHMRSFDVSDDLSARTVIGPAILADQSPGVSLKISLYTK